MLRVLTLTTLYPNTAQPGLGGFVARQTERLARHPDVDLHVIAPIGIPPIAFGRYRPLTRLPRSENWQGVRVHRPRFTLLPLIGARTNPAAIVRAALPVMKQLRADGFDFDIIDAEFFFPCGVAAAALGRHFDRPVSIKARGSDIHLWGHMPAVRPAILRAGHAAAGMLAVSAALKSDMVALGLPEDHIQVHYTGVDLDRFHPQDKNAAKAVLQVSGPLIVSIGNLVPLKGHDIIIRAMAAIPEATLIVAGDGPERARLQALAEGSGYHDRIRFLGRLDHDSIPLLLAAADVMALASEREGLANVWVEALACGTPVIAPAIGSIREVIDRPSAGLIVPERTPAAFATAIRSLLENPPAPETVRAAAARFSWESNTAALYAHLGSLSAVER